MKRRGLLTKMLETCNNETSLVQLHSLSLKYGFVHDSFIATKLELLYSKYASVGHARRLFDEMPEKTVYLWNALLRSYYSVGEWGESLGLFRQMIFHGATSGEKPDNFTVSIAIKACAGLHCIELGTMIHGFAKKEKVDEDMFVGTALIEFYSKCGLMDDASKVFAEYSKPDVFLWTSMISGYQQNGSPEEALSFLSRMVVMEHINPAPVTLVSAASACAQLPNYKLGSSLHGYITRRGYETNLSLVNSLLNLYARTGSVKNAVNLFRKMPMKDVISWSSMIACFARNGASAEALDIFYEMIDKRVEPNAITVISVLRACASSSNLEKGKKIHEYAICRGFESDTSVSTALIDMYMKCSSPENAVDLFGRMPRKDVVSWAALLDGYAQNGMAGKSMGVFCNMLSSETKPDAIAVVKVLAACAELGIFQHAACLHGYAIKSGFDSNVFVGASLIELYAKCSSIDDAIEVFEGITEKDTVIWSSMIAGFGVLGQGKEAIQLFDQMVNNSTVKPNGITFLSALSACSHAGLVDDGLKIFNMMLNDYKLNPGSEHYGILVDLLGRTGELDKAMDVIHHMPSLAGPHVWGALLSACRMHQNVKMGEIAAKNLFQLDPSHAGYYKLLSTIYAMDKDWDNVARLRTLVKEKALKKTQGQSVVEIRHEIHSFVAGDRYHRESDYIYEILRKLESVMREEGSVPRTQMEGRKFCKF